MKWHRIYIKWFLTLGAFIGAGALAIYETGEFIDTMMQALALTAGCSSMFTFFEAYLGPKAKHKAINEAIELFDGELKQDDIVAGELNGHTILIEVSFKLGLSELSDQGVRIRFYITHQSLKKYAGGRPKEAVDSICLGKSMVNIYETNGSGMHVAHSRLAVALR